MALGSPLVADGSPAPRLLATLTRTLELARRDASALIVVTGGAVKSGAEGPAMRDWLVQHGVEPTRIMVESQARDTLENGQLCAPIIAGAGRRNVTLVTAPYHMRRAAFVVGSVLQEHGISVLGIAGDSVLHGKKLQHRNCTETVALFRDGARAEGLWNHPTHNESVRVCQLMQGAALKSPRQARKERVLDKALAILRENRVTIDGHTFTTPSLDPTIGYAGRQWLWDSAFHAQILAQHEPEVAKSELRAVFANQRDDGFVPHMNYFKGDAQYLSAEEQEVYRDFLQRHDGAGLSKAEQQQFATTFWLNDKHSDITQPPILARAVEDVFRATGDRAFVREMLPGLKSYYDYLHDKRDPDHTDLISIIHQWESGWDHSQRWDAAIGVTQGDKAHVHARKMEVFMHHKALGWNEERIFARDLFNVKPVDFNVLYASNMQALSRLCAATGDRAGANRFAAMADATRQAIFEKMWNGETYVDLIGRDCAPSPVKSAAMFFPMMLDGESHGRTLIHDHLTNDREFNVRHMLPTTAADDERFDGSQYWRGNVWLNVNTFVWLGLQKYIESHPNDDSARKMADRIEDSSFELLDRSGFCEYFDPHTGEGHCARGFGWNGIVCLMAEDRPSV